MAIKKDETSVKALKSGVWYTVASFLKKGSKEKMKKHLFLAMIG